MARNQESFWPKEGVVLFDPRQTKQRPRGWKGVPDQDGLHHANGTDPTNRHPAGSTDAGPEDRIVPSSKCSGNNAWNELRKRAAAKLDGGGFWVEPLGQFDWRIQPLQVTDGSGVDFWLHYRNSMGAMNTGWPLLEEALLANLSVSDSDRVAGRERPIRITPDPSASPFKNWANELWLPGFVRVPKEERQHAVPSLYIGVFNQAPAAIKAAAAGLAHSAVRFQIVHTAGGQTGAGLAPAPQGGEVMDPETVLKGLEPVLDARATRVARSFGLGQGLLATSQETLAETAPAWFV